MEYKSNHNVAYSCKYHVVWCPKYRRKVLVNGVGVRLKELIGEICKEFQIDMIEMDIMPDHVHLLVEVDPPFGIHKAVKHIKGRILSATVSQNPSGKYFVALCCTDVERKPLPSTGAAVGIDMGLKAFAITFDGTYYPNHRYLAGSQKKLARLQRQLSRKTKGSKRREKAQLRLARLHEHIANQW